MFLSDFDGLNIGDDFVKVKEIQNDRTEVLNHGCIHTKDEGYFRINYLPTNISYNIDGSSYDQDIHEFDFNNLYWIDGYWNYGSCPHLFFISNCQQVIYQGELFATQPGVISSYSFQIQNNTKSFVIAELEREVTTINYIKVNDIVKASDIRLNTGQSVEVLVAGDDIVKIEGYYHVKSKNYVGLSAFEKHSLIERFKSKYDHYQEMQFS